MGDIVDPAGVTFQNPVPLLLHHDQTKPIGSVRFDPPTADGITFDATIPIVAEAGALKDRLDEAWQSIKAGLMSGVSIGFRILKDGATLRKGGGAVADEDGNSRTVIGHDSGERRRDHPDDPGARCA